MSPVRLAAEAKSAAEGALAAKAAAPGRRRRNRAREMLAEGEFTVDELAQRAGTTVRNILAYQTRRILPPPEKRGRLGVYADKHLQRLLKISRWLERGDSIARIAKRLSADIASGDEVSAPKPL